ncbi:PEP-utilizing enzyme [Candidatus Methanodesulfokora washburnensis]|uniref:PEP-utilizing enzyme n=1 Tax=Candidatus Methanodesulfokora washburnensis TaxID=2478471 RepID=UPI0013867A90|nr:PEP-utilizing enzyme [Candidatus Methanodesulfokores washburnensis]
MDNVRPKLLIKGIGASRGKYRGKVYIVANKGRNSPLAEEVEVVVVPFLSPFDIFIVLHAKALIMEHGGVTSHGAVIARELGIPCVIAENAINLLKDGMDVFVDGDEGCIYVYQ